MKEIECDVIRDLLPLYADEACSEKSRALVYEHLLDCPDCRKMLQMAKAGKYNGYLLEGKACPGGCVAGAGVIVPAKKSSAAVVKNSESAQIACALDSDYLHYLNIIEEGRFAEP